MTAQNSQKSFLRARAWRLLGILLSILTPVIFALTVAWRGNGVLARLGYFGHIAGNIYRANSVLLVLLIAAQLGVAIGLIFYSVEVFTSVVRAARGGGRTTIGCASLILLAIPTVIFVIFLSFVLIVSAGWLRPDVWTGRFTNLVVEARYVTLLTFAVFLWLDAGFMVEGRRELRRLAEERRKHEIAAAKVQDDNHLQEKTKNEIATTKVQNDYDLASGATWFINIPTLLVTASMWALVHRLATRPEFHLFRDMQFKAHVVEAPLPPVTFELFVNGIEAGVLAAVLMFSQLIFAALRVRWEYCDFKVPAPPPAQTVASEPELGQESP